MKVAREEYAKKFNQNFNQKSNSLWLFFKIGWIMMRAKNYARVKRYLN